LLGHSVIYEERFFIANDHYIITEIERERDG